VGPYSLINSATGQNASYTGHDYVQYAPDFNTDFNTGANLPMGGTLAITAVSAATRRFSCAFSFIGIGVNTTPHVRAPFQTLGSALPAHMGP